MDQKQKDKDRSADHSPREDNEDANYYDMLNQLDRLARLEVQRKAEIKPREERILSQRTSRTENRSEGALEDTAQDMFQKLYTHEEDNDSETSGSLSESSLTEDIRINDDANREEGGTHAREEEDGEKNENGEYLQEVSGMNIKFVLDALSVCTDDDIVIHQNNIFLPLMIDEKDTTYVLMPMRV